MGLLEFDQELRASGFPLLCGVDEAGRGPLAGPVFAAAVVLPPDFCPQWLGDSKKVTPKRREALYAQITASCLWCVATASVEEIDQLNILQATYLAMKRAWDGLVVEAGEPDLTLVDGNRAPPYVSHVETVVGGDGKSASIAAASILAKVSRDRHMVELAQAYPQYQLEKHKGYGTKLHYELLDQYGASPIHRRSFLKSWEGGK